MGYHIRQSYINSKIRSLLTSLTKEPSEYEETALKIEYWIEYVLCENFSTVDELVEGVSSVAWDEGTSCPASIGKFLKEFHDAPHRSEKTRGFVTKMCSHVLRWFTIAAVEDFWGRDNNLSHILGCRPYGFIRGASFIGYLIEWGLLSHGLAKWHITKSLTNHHDNDRHVKSPGATRANAIYQLFTAAGNTLLQGFLEPVDVQVCLDILDTWSQQRGMSFDVAKLKVRYTTNNHASRWSLTRKQEFRELHAAWVLRREGEEKTRETEGNQREREEGMAATDVSAEIKTPVAFVPPDLPAAAIGIEIPASILQDIESSSVFSEGDNPLETFIDVSSGTASPTLSISTVSDLTPAELGETGNGSGQVACHDTFYFEDGNVEIVCGETIFRVHSTIVSFSSSELREILSQHALLNAPTPEGRPRITISDSAEDFTTLLKMIYTPG